MTRGDSRRDTMRICPPLVDPLLVVISYFAALQLRVDVPMSSD